MNRFERQTTLDTDKHTLERQLVASRSISLPDAYQDHLNSNLEAVTRTIESIQHTPDKSRTVYREVASPTTNAAYDLDITRQQDNLEELRISAFGGVADDPAIYTYRSKDGYFTKQIKESKHAQHVELDEIINRLAADYPDNNIVRELQDSPTDTLDTDFIIYLLENSLTEYAEARDADKATQKRYSITSVEISDDATPLDRTDELIVTTTNQGNHYQLDADFPYDPTRPDLRKSINYQVTNAVNAAQWGNATCTAMLRAKEKPRRQATEAAVRTTQNDAYYELLRAMDGLSRSSETLTVD